MNRIFAIILLILSLAQPTFSQSLTKAEKERLNAGNKALVNAKNNIKKNSNLENTEKDMRKLLSDTLFSNDEKVWLTLFDAVRKQYDQVNEKLYLKQQSDTAKFFNCTLHMFELLLQLDSIDTNIDGKGHRQKHASFLNKYRDNLYSGGTYFLKKQNYKEASGYFNVYVECSWHPMFTNYEYARKDKRLAEAAYWALFCGYKMKDTNQVLRYNGIAMNDKPHYPYTLQYLAETYSAIGDTINYERVVREGFQFHPEYPFFFSRLVVFLADQGRHEEVLTICDDAIEREPNNSIFLLAKSSCLLNMQRYDDAIAFADQVIAVDDKLAPAYLNAGLAFYNRIPEIENAQDMRLKEREMAIQDLCKSALVYLAKYRQMEPERPDLWAVPLYNIYLNLNMGTEFDEMDVILRELQQK